MNALKTGIHSTAPLIPGETQEERRDIMLQVQERWNPTTPEQQSQVDAIIHDEWMLRRLRLADDGLFFRGYHNAFDPKPSQAHAQAYENSSRTGTRLQYRLSGLERSLRLAVHELERLKKLASEPARLQPEPPAVQPEPQPEPEQPQAAAQPEPQNPQPDLPQPPSEPVPTPEEPPQPPSEPVPTPGEPPQPPPEPVPTPIQAAEKPAVPTVDSSFRSFSSEPAGPPPARPVIPVRPTAGPPPDASCRC